MKIAVSSDWHGQPPLRKDQKVIETCDALLLAGDILEVHDYGNNVVDELARFLLKLKDKGIPVIMTPGNHDFHIYNGWLEDSPDIKDFLRKKIKPRLRYGRDRIPYSVNFLEQLLGVKILIDCIYIFNGIRIYGTPWSPEFYGWAFMREDEDLYNIFQNIPSNTDILLAHTPPWIEGERLDVVVGRNDHCGSKALAQTVTEKTNLKYAFFGHIHSGDHTPLKFGNTILQNVSYLNEAYQAGDYPITVIEV